MRKILVFSILFMLVLTEGAYSQFGGKAQQSPRFYSDFKPVIGGWSEYQMKSQAEKPTIMKISIVGKEGDAYWYETMMDMQGRMITKILVSGNPDDQKNVKRMIMKQRNDPAMEMPVMAMDQQQSAAGKPKGKMIDKGMEKITVPAGTFTAHHFQYQEGQNVVDTWVNDKVSPYGLVKSQSKDFEMVLTGYGTGAKTLITETPKKFQMPAMPQGMPKGMMPNMNIPDEE